ncbi:hypothetical protein QMK19_08410 [Streptomyces sp. H10-C2]|uniref:MBL fold metallo-hydrolase n=1 Tax=unclassified Streptomyces TaxID=2593676 RepID=UPI0024B8D0BE|nr:MULTISPECIES: MBL fold metallo-hydrolase [unclassified Streptomyces]MDJ0344816.1 hypothetical protein [Streptomyces sp. PH10-H1]MDJ0369701.1 hypothetical protein [Streptomyces sp. H10-C2]
MVSTLNRVAANVHVWNPPGAGTWGLANCVLIDAGTSGEPALLFDVPYDRPLTRKLQALAADLLAPNGAAIGTIVNSHANGDHSYGNGLFPGVDIISTEANRQHICAEPSPEELAHLLRVTSRDTPLGWYMGRHFDRYDLTGLKTVGPTSTFSGQMTLRVGDLQVDLYEVGPRTPSAT